MGELVKKVKIDAGDYQRGTDETGSHWHGEHQEDMLLRQQTLPHKS